MVNFVYDFYSDLSSEERYIWENGIYIFRETASRDFEDHCIDVKKVRLFEF